MTENDLTQMAKDFGLRTVIAVITAKEVLGGAEAMSIWGDLSADQKDATFLAALGLLVGALRSGRPDTPLLETLQRLGVSLAAATEQP